MISLLSMQSCFSSVTATDMCWSHAPHRLRNMPLLRRHRTGPSSLQAGVPRLLIRDVLLEEHHLSRTSEEIPMTHILELNKSILKQKKIDLTTNE
jgi:hypothetical protein